MRLRDIQNTIEKYNDHLNLKKSTIQGDNLNVKIENVFNSRMAFDKLREMGIFKIQFENIQKNETFYYSGSDSITLPIATADKLINMTNSLKQHLTIFKAGISGIIPEQHEFSISIKYPKINDLLELSKISERLNIALDQAVVNDYIGGEVRVQNFDTGTEWVELLLNSKEAVSVIALIVYAVIYLKREKIKNDEMLEVVRNRKITNDMIEGLHQQLRNHLERVMDQHVEDIAQKAGAPVDDKEYHGRIKFCIKEMTTLIDKGMKFFPSSKSPNDLKEKFPDFTKGSVEDMIPKRKEIENKNNQESQTDNGSEQP